MSAAMALITVSLVAAVGIFRMFQIPERTPARDHRNRREVVRRRWRARGPLERPGVPGIFPALSPFKYETTRFAHKHENRDGLE